MLKEKFEELEATRLIVCGWIREQMAMIGTDIVLSKPIITREPDHVTMGDVITKLLVNGNVIEKSVDYIDTEWDKEDEHVLGSFDANTISEIEQYLIEMFENQVEAAKRFFNEPLRTTDVKVTIVNNPFPNHLFLNNTNYDLASLDKTFDCKMSVEEQKALVDEFVKIMDNPSLTLDNLDKAERRYNEYLESRHESKGYNRNKKPCEANCAEHVGEVIKVSVRDKTVSNSKTFKCNYCQTAIDEHIERGFEVTVSQQFDIC